MRARIVFRAPRNGDTDGLYYVKPRRGHKEDWERHNPVLVDKEIGIDLTTAMAKIGDGIHAWNELSYAQPADISSLIIMAAFE